MAAPLLKVSVATTTAAAETVASVLSETLSQPAVTHTDLRTGVTRASVYLAQRSAWTPAKRQQLEAVVDALSAAGWAVGSGRIRVERVRREDWAHSWKRHFRPFSIGRALLVRPSWSRRRKAPGQAQVVLDPGLSFGTGQHPTTRFCLEQLVAARRQGTAQSFLDLGTGSGILAIAAAKLGYSPVVGIDCDADAIRVARANVRRNRVAGQVRFLHLDLLRLTPRRRGCTLVCANLIANLLLAERRRILRCVAAGGTLVLAGILRAEFDDVRKAYEAAGSRLVRSRRQGEWASGAFRAP